MVIELEEAIEEVLNGVDSVISTGSDSDLLLLIHQFVLILKNWAGSVLLKDYQRRKKFGVCPQILKSGPCVYSRFCHQKLSLDRIVDHYT